MPGILIDEFLTFQFNCIRIGALLHRIEGENATLQITQTERSVARNGLQIYFRPFLLLAQRQIHLRLCATETVWFSDH